MAESIGDLAVRIISDASGFLAGMTPVNQAFQTAEQGASKMGQEVSRWLDKMAADAAKAGEQMGTSLRSGLASLTGVGAIAGGLGLEQLATKFGDTLHESIVSAIDKAKREAVLDIAIRNQGSISGFSRDELGQYAVQRERQTGFSRGDIMEEARTLSRFTEVSGDLARRTLNVGQDFARYTGGDLQQSILRLGEMLNDPTRLRGTRELGITGEQRTDIEAMAKMGDIAGAQEKLISTLEKTLGGAAQATKGPLDELGNEFHRLSVELGGSAIPALRAYGEAALSWAHLIGGMIPNPEGRISAAEAMRSPEQNRQFMAQNMADVAAPYQHGGPLGMLMHPLDTIWGAGRMLMAGDRMSQMDDMQKSSNESKESQDKWQRYYKSYGLSNPYTPPFNKEAQQFLDRMKGQEAHESLNPYKAGVDEWLQTHKVTGGEQTALYGEAQKLASAEADKLIQNMVTNWSQIKDSAGVYEQTLKRIDALDPNKLGPATEAFNKGQATWEAKEEERKSQEAHDRQEKQDQAAADRFQQSLKTPQDLWGDEKKQLDRLVASGKIHDFERDAILERDRPRSRPELPPSTTTWTSGGFGATGAGFGAGGSVMEQVASSVKNVDRNTKEMVGELKRLKPPAAGN